MGVLYRGRRPNETSRYSSAFVCRGTVVCSVTVTFETTPTKQPYEKKSSNVGPPCLWKTLPIDSVFSSPPLSFHSWTTYPNNEWMNEWMNESTPQCGIIQGLDSISFPVLSTREWYVPSISGGIWSHQITKMYLVFYKSITYRTIGRCGRYVFSSGKV